MCEYLGYDVEKLERIRIMNVSVKGIGIGDWRFLDEKEMKELKAAIADSSNENLSSTLKQPVASGKDSKRKTTRATFNESFASSKKTHSKRNNVPFNPKAKELRGKGKAKSSSRAYRKK